MAELYTLESIHKSTSRIWSLIDEGLIREAHVIAENLIQEVSHQIATKRDELQFIYAFALMYHAAAHATSLSVRTEEVGQAIYYYQEMEYFARQIKDNTLVSIALSYQGDVQCRKGNIPQAIEYLEAARDIAFKKDDAAHGNALQLLARSYIRAGRVSEFDNALKASEDLAEKINHRPRSTGNQFHLAHVYEEYAKGYGSLGKVQQALDYVDLAEKARPTTKSVEILLKVARAEILIHSGDMSQGVPLAVEAASYTREHGHYRRLERLYALRRYVNRQLLRYGKAETALSEALEGPIES